jgi:hypothetical protein
MSRSLSRTVRLYLVFAAIAIGAGTEIAIRHFDPAIASGIGSLAGGVGAVLVAIGRKRARDRIAHRADNTAQAVAKTDTTTTKLKCRACQHVQMVPVSQATFVCEQCHTHLKRSTATANSS